MMQEAPNKFDEMEKELEKTLLKACLYKTVSVAAKMISSGLVNINAQDETTGYTPLLLCCIIKMGKDAGNDSMDAPEENIDLIRLILERPNLDINHRDHDGNTALAQACSNFDSVRLVDLLLTKKGIDINLSNNDGESPFFIACKKGHRQVVKYLLTIAECNITKPDERLSSTPLYIACHLDHVDIIKLLINDPRTKMDIHKQSPKDPSPYYLMFLRCFKYYELYKLMDKASPRLIESLPKEEVEGDAMTQDKVIELESFFDENLENPVLSGTSSEENSINENMLNIQISDNEDEGEKNEFPPIPNNSQSLQYWFD